MFSCFRLNKRKISQEESILNSVAPKGFIFGRLVCLNVLRGSPTLQKVQDLTALLAKKNDAAFSANVIKRVKTRQLQLIKRKKYLGRFIGKDRRERLEQVIALMDKIINEKGNTKNHSEEINQNESYNLSQNAPPSPRQINQITPINNPETPSSSASNSSEKTIASVQKANEVFIPGLDSICFETPRYCLREGFIFTSKSILKEISPSDSHLDLLCSFLSILIPGYSKIEGGKLKREDLPKLEIVYKESNCDLHISFVSKEQANGLFRLFKTSPRFSKTTVYNPAQNPETITLQGVDTIVNLTSLDPLNDLDEEPEFYASLAKEETTKIKEMFHDLVALEKKSLDITTHRYKKEKPILIAPTQRLNFSNSIKSCRVKAEAMSCSALPFVEKNSNLQKGQTQCSITLKEKEGLTISFFDSSNNSKLIQAIQAAYPKTYLKMSLVENKIGCIDSETIIRYLKQICLLDSQEIKTFIEEELTSESHLKKKLLIDCEKELRNFSSNHYQPETEPSTRLLRDLSVTDEQIQPLLPFLKVKVCNLSSHKRLPPLKEETEKLNLAETLKQIFLHGLNGVDLHSFVTKDETAPSKENLLNNLNQLCNQIIAGHSELKGVAKTKWSDKRKKELLRIVELLLYLKENIAASDDVQKNQMVQEQSNLLLIQLILSGVECANGIKRSVKRTLHSLIDLLKPAEYETEEALKLPEVDLNAKKGIDRILSGYREKILNEVAIALSNEDENSIERIRDHCRDCLATSRGLKKLEKDEVQLQNRQAIISTIAKEKVLNLFDEKYTATAILNHLRTVLSYVGDEADFLQYELIDFFKAHKPKEIAIEDLLGEIFYEDEASSKTFIQSIYLLQTLLILDYFE